MTSNIYHLNWLAWVHSIRIQNSFVGWVKFPLEVLYNVLSLVFKSYYLQERKDHTNGAPLHYGWHTLIVKKESDLGKHLFKNHGFYCFGFIQYEMKITMKFAIPKKSRMDIHLPVLTIFHVCQCNSLSNTKQGCLWY